MDLTGAEVSTSRFRCWLLLPGVLAGLVLGVWAASINGHDWYAGLVVFIVLTLSGVVRSLYWSRKTLDGKLKTTSKGMVLLVDGEEFRVDLVELNGTNFAPFAKFPSGDSVTVLAGEGVVTVRYFDRVFPQVLRGEATND
ncbi:hypothetical protein IEE94_07965 [Yimella sp. cx-573]|nr:hypothetical protein [Yimella sp. cx-573]